MVSVGLKKKENAIHQHKKVIIFSQELVYVHIDLVFDGMVGGIRVFAFLWFPIVSLVTADNFVFVGT